MKSIRKYAVSILGGFQCIVGAAASVFAYLIYASASVQKELSIEQGEVAFLMFILLVFAFFSMLSGINFLHEKC